MLDNLHLLLKKDRFHTIKNRGDAKEDYYAYGISSDIISDITSVGQLRVASLSSVEELQKEGLKNNEISEKLSSRYIVSGSLWKIDSIFQLSMELFDTKEEMLLTSQRWEMNWGDLSLVKGDLSKKIIEELKKIGVNLKLITDGDVSGSLLVTDEKYNVDLFMGIGGGPEGVLAASALDSFNCFFQGRFIFDNDKDKKRANEMGIKDLNKKYELSEIISGDSVFCATGITTGDLVSGIEIIDNEFISETLITHKSTGLKKIIKKRQNI